MNKLGEKMKVLMYAPLKIFPAMLGCLRLEEKKNEKARGVNANSRWRWRWWWNGDDYEGNEATGIVSLCFLVAVKAQGRAPLWLKMPVAKNPTSPLLTGQFVELGGLG